MKEWCAVTNFIFHSHQGLCASAEFQGVRPQFYESACFLLAGFSPRVRFTHLVEMTSG